MLRFEALLDSIDDAQYEEQFVACLDLFARMQAVVALAAVVGFVFFSEIMEQEFASADGCLGVGSCFLKQLPTDVLFCYGLALHELLKLAQVMRREEGQTDSLAAIATGTACLLIVTLQTFWDIVVDDIADIWFVDAHTKGNGSHDDIDALHEEVILGLGSFC